MSLLNLSIQQSGKAADKLEGKSRLEKLELFNKVLTLIEQQYYRDVDTAKLIEGAINGMMGTLDPHSAYLDKEVFQKMQDETSGEFGGLGIEVTQKDGVLLIVTPIEDSPAEKAGILAGDRIVEINHEPVVGLGLEKSMDKFRGKKKSKITLGIIREGHEGIKNIEIVRDTVYLKPVKFELLKDQVAYIRLSQFQKKSGEYILEALKKMKSEAPKNQLNAIILDLRSNPGGLLDEAVEVASLFIDDGIVVSTEGRDPKNKEFRYVKKGGYKDLTTPMAVLINGSSASASEIVAGALQDNKRALVMGTQSFGKGSVQSVVKLQEEMGVKLTIAQYMTSAGRKIQALGIKPDVEIDEVEAEWVGQNKKEPNFLREKDLKNHLTATLETEEEKKLREELEFKERLQRAEKYNLIKEKKRKSKDAKNLVNEEESKKIAPIDDYMVKQAINYLANLNRLKK